MNRPTYLRTTIPPARSPINRSALRRGFILIALTLFFGLLPASVAVTPAPDGGYQGGNTAEGDNALFSLTFGSNNTAIGFDALANDGSGASNTATGYGTLYINTTGSDNTANGGSALQNNTTGNFNTANGAESLFDNTTGIQNTANGAFALESNTTGNSNTASGVFALGSNSTGSDNTAIGYVALNSSTTGSNNMASGFNALFSNTTGSNNTANGVNALFHNTTGKSNIALGASAGTNLTTGSNNIDIGNLGVAGDANKIRIGKQGTQNATFIAGIFGATVANGVAVRIDSTGHLGTLTSSARFKEAIKPMEGASEAILALKPVTFRYKEELDPDKIPQFGLVAEQVEKVNPDLVVRDEEGKVNTVRYEAVNAMLLNEFLKEHQKVQELEKQIQALTATVQRVSDQIALGKPAAKLVANP
jgi:hypothetical protein